MICISDNWIVNILENALTDWNGKLSEIWALLTQTPQSFKGGDIWTMITGIHNAMVGIGYGLLVLFFAMGVFQSAASFRDFQRPEFALRHFIRFVLAKVAVGSCMEIMTAIFSVCGGIIATVMSGMGGSVSTAATLPSEIVTAIEGLGLLEATDLVVPNPFQLQDTSCSTYLMHCDFDGIALYASAARAQMEEAMRAQGEDPAKAQVTWEMHQSDLPPKQAQQSAPPKRPKKKGMFGRLFGGKD